MKKRLLVVPARKGSKRIKNKNIVNFFGKPIIEYGINVALDTKIFDKIYISSNDQKILNKIKFNKIIEKALRPSSLSKDNTPLIDVINYILNDLIKKEERYDQVWMLLPCSPLIDNNTFLKAKKIMNKKTSKAFTTVGKSRVPFYWYYKIIKNKLIPFFKNHLKSPSQKLPKTFYEIGVLAGWKVDHFLNCYKKRRNFEFSPLILDFFKSFDIDTEEDLKIIKKIYKYKIHKN